MKSRPILSALPAIKNGAPNATAGVELGATARRQRSMVRPYLNSIVRDQLEAIIIAYVDDLVMSGVTGWSIPVDGDDRSLVTGM